MLRARSSGVRWKGAGFDRSRDIGGNRVGRGLVTGRVKVLDERLASLGAPLVKGRRFVPTAVADGNLITGQNP